MRKTLLAAAAAFIVGGIATGSVLSQAQSTPPGPATEHRGMMGWRNGAGHRRPFNRGDFALIYRQPDRQLAPADVQKIAEGFLLWNGNHSWKVTNVAATPDGPIGFSVETPEGSMVAKFTMDPHTGRIARVG
jgi:hypothetical protein